MSKHSGFTYLNIRCLISQKQSFKTKYLADIASNKLFIALTETWLSNGVKDAEIAIPGFSLLRSDRVSSNNYPHGGVAIYISDQFQVEETHRFSNGICDYIFVKIPKVKMAVCVFYRPPNAATQKFSEAIDSVQNLLLGCGDNFSKILLGDFNLPGQNWKTGEAKPVSPIEREATRKLKEVTRNVFLEEKVCGPTRGKNALDLIFCSNHELIRSIEISPVNSRMSDHDKIEVTINSITRLTVSEPPICEYPYLARFNFFKADWKKVNQKLQEKDLMEKTQSADTVDDAYEYLIQGLVDSCIQAEVPVKKKPRKQDIPKDRKCLFQKQVRLLKRRKAVNKQDNCKCSPKSVQEEAVSVKCVVCNYRTILQANSINKKLTEVNKMLTTSYINERQKAEAEALSKIKENPKYFFKFAKAKSKVRETIGPLSDGKGAHVDTPKDLANILNEQYASAFSVPKAEAAVGKADDFFDENTKLSDVCFSIGDVKEAMKSFREDAAPGPDYFPAAVLKYCADTLADPLYSLLRKSLDTGKLPNQFKRAIVTPLYKGGDRSTPSNYRPVALTSHVAKCLEKVIRRHLVNYLESNKLMNTSQHGFRAGRSTISQLIEHLECVLNGLEEGKNVDVVYLDFSKAFDKVDHGILLHEMKRLGIGGKIGRWIRAFLQERTQQVSVEKSLSDTVNVASGVPQGTVLGPVLFLIVLLTIDENIHYCTLGSFADDSKLIKFVENKQDTIQLQEDLQTVYEWADKVNMKLNGKKFQLLRYGTNNKLKQDTEYTTSEGNTIESCESCRDLGIVLSSEGDFAQHIQKVTKSAFQMCGWILRTFHTREIDPMITLFKSLVLSRLDYGSIVYHPSRKTLTDEVENVQRTFTRRINGLRDLDYWKRLEKLQLYSVQRRHERYMIIYIFKILKGLVPNCGIIFRESERRGFTADIKVCKSTAPSIAKQMRTNSFAHRGPRLFNALPIELRTFSIDNDEDIVDIVSAFKRKLDKFLKNVPDQPTVPGLPRVANSNSLVDQIFCKV